MQIYKTDNAITYRIDGDENESTLFLIGNQETGDTDNSYNLGYQAGLEWYFKSTGSDDMALTSAWNYAYVAALNNGYNNAAEMANRFMAGYQRGMQE